MQLRVARLCLDCEELHLDNTCPVCASERYAFLSQWLPTEERRRWRLPVHREPQPEGVGAVTETIARWIRGEGASESPQTPLTRRSDHVAHLDFEEAAQRDSTAPAIKPRPELKKRDA